jgi:hypothetical protein
MLRMKSPVGLCAGDIAAHPLINAANAMSNHGANDRTVCVKIFITTLNVNGYRESVSKSKNVA